MNAGDEVVARWLAGGLSAEERAELERRLLADPGLRGRVGGQVVIDALLGVALEDEFSAARRRGRWQEALRRADQEDFVAGVAAKIRQRSWRRRALAAAALLAFAVAGRVIFAPEAAVVARVVRLETLRWAEGVRLEEGHSIQAGTRLRFEAGLVELDVQGKGRMILEGPADLELAGPMRAVLHRGRVILRVNPAGHGYRLETSKGAVVDLGTEFGVVVDEQQRVETHVIDGEVEAIPEGGRKVLLRKNDALRFSGGDGERFTADGGSFYTALPPARTGLPRRVHWPMEGGGDGRDRARVGGFGGGDCDMILQGAEGSGPPRPVAGVFGAALAFDGRGSYAESGFPGIGGQEPRTVSFWVKVPRDFRVSEGFGIVSWGEFGVRNFGEVWQVSINPVAEEGPVGRLRVGAHGGQIVGASDLRDGRWHHVAVVLYQASQPDIGKHVLIYLDGELEPISRRALHEVNTRVDDAGHGVWLGRNIAHSPQPPGQGAGGFFRGEVDEVFLFAGALSHDEIRALKERNEPPR